MAALVLTAGVLVGLRPSRLRVVRPDAGNVSERRSLDLESFVVDGRHRLVLCVLAGGVVGLVMAGPMLGVLGGVGGVIASVVVGRLESPVVAREREQAKRALPTAVDLLAACTSVGQPPDRALAYVASTTSGRLGRQLGDISARLELGAEPVVEWRRHLDDEVVGSLARTMLRSIEAGAPLADGLSRLASDRRRELRALLDSKARAVGVKATAPLGVCFLPAFMIVGVAPTIITLFQTIMST